MRPLSKEDVSSLKPNQGYTSFTSIWYKFSTASGSVNGVVMLNITGEREKRGRGMGKVHADLRSPTDGK